MLTSGEYFKYFGKRGQFISGTKIITSSFGPTKEYLSDKAVFLEKTDVYFASPLNTVYRVFDSEEIADKNIFSSMNHKPHNQKEIKKTIRAADKYSWKKIIKNWIAIM